MTLLTERPLVRQLVVFGAVSAVVGASATALLNAQARWARHLIGTPFGEQAPDVEGTYGTGPGVPITVGMLGDSTAAGLGVDNPQHTAAAIIASGLAAMSGRRVRLVSSACVGANSGHLADQVTDLLRRAPGIDVAVILVGGNDVTHKANPKTAARQLAAAVQRLRANGAEVVVGTCPDLGTLKPVPRPLRWIARHSSRVLAQAQTVAVIQAGGRTVSIADMLGPEFDASPAALFSHDRFHPSAAGYARCGAALLPSVCAAARLWPNTPGRHHQHGISSGAATAALPVGGSPTESAAAIADAASTAVAAPGTEMAPPPTDDIRRRWAGLQQLRRRKDAAPTATQLSTSHRPPEQRSA